MIRLFLCGIGLGMTLHALWTAWQIRADTLLMPLLLLLALLGWQAHRAWLRVRWRLRKLLSPATN